MLACSDTTNGSRICRVPRLARLRDRTRDLILAAVAFERWEGLDLETPRGSEGFLLPDGHSTGSGQAKAFEFLVHVV